MPNKLFQGMVHQMHNAVGRTIGVLDETSTVIACSDLDQIGDIRETITPDFYERPDSTLISNNYTFKSLDSKDGSQYAIFVKGDDELAQKYISILAISFSNLKNFYDAKYDRSNFVKNVILDNILPSDIFIKARELHFSVNVPRVCILIKLQAKSDVSVFEVLQNLFPEKAKDFVISIDDTDIAIVKEVPEDITLEDLKQLAKSIIDTLAGEYYVHCTIGLGTVVNNINGLASSFKEAQIALDVSRVFDTEKVIVSYENLGIARLIYQLPTTLCEMFLNEVFKRESIDTLDQETLFTIQRFFENNLNVSETSRKLFVHRNTLVYRLEKIKRLTGLDLREFEDAIVFKFALMVRKYLGNTGHYRHSL